MTGVPAFRQIAAELRDEIVSGDMPVGSQLPSMSQLRARYEVSSTVVRDALNELRREGLIMGKQGKGVFVERRPAEGSANGGEQDEIVRRLDGLTEAVQELGRRVDALEGRKSR
ncbi:GntR family transcriptional regulator [Phytoactinopolyspora endophytica]|uniref:GntR family transcriptional regulator n=1 Tax=Phytoactinopolyspora endophytica TaxID=1642495 RepID=UPI00101DDDEF|nr:GntR family transcriptional regulator [Phytoactinopolyspora endophytica]